MAPPTLMTANRCEDTDVKCDRYCWTSLLEPTLLRVWMTMPRVLRSVSCLVEVERARRVQSASRALATIGAAAAVRDVGRRAHRRAPARKALTEVDSMIARDVTVVSGRKLASAKGKAECLLCRSSGEKAIGLVVESSLSGCLTLSLALVGCRAERDRIKRGRRRGLLVVDSRCLLF